MASDRCCCHAPNLGACRHCAEETLLLRARNDWEALMMGVTAGVASLLNPKWLLDVAWCVFGQ